MIYHEIANSNANVDNFHNELKYSKNSAIERYDSVYDDTVCISKKYLLNKL